MLFLRFVPCMWELLKDLTQVVMRNFLSSDNGTLQTSQNQTPTLACEFENVGKQA